MDAADTADAGSRLRRFLDDLGTVPAGPSNRIAVARIDSTNRLARRVVESYLAEEAAPPGFFVFALEQTGGRGRLGRTWQSPAEAGVYATRVLPLPAGDGGAGPSRETTEALQSLPLLVAVGLARALGRVLDRHGSRSRCALEWPNDVLVEGEKIGGILAESLALGSRPPVVLLGFGVNHARPPGAPELPAGATALADHVASPPSLGAFAGELLAGVEAELEHLGELAYAVAAYRGLSVHRPGDRLSCRSGGEIVEGEFAGFDERGHLLLVRGGETVLLAAGEIVEDRTYDG